MSRPARAVCPEIHLDPMPAIAYFRYSLGRASYITGMCADWLIANWAKLPSDQQALIVREIEQAKVQEALGWGGDAASWQRVLDRAVLHADGVPRRPEPVPTRLDTVPRCGCCEDTQTPGRHICYPGHACATSACGWCGHPLNEHATEARHA